MSGIIFKVDRKAIKEGEAVIIHWECQNPDSVSLKVDDGYQSAILQLADSGNREISITRSKGKTILTLRVVENGKLKKKEISIKVKKEKPQKARPADNTG
ncbi:MAG: hypothetical protein LKJ93_00805, partial [Bacteroidales bacterium]|nr:hypothetical protein [Bacteroidales bacterium]